MGPGVGAAGEGEGRPAGGPGRAPRPSLLEQRRERLGSWVWGRLGAPVHTPTSAQEPQPDFLSHGAVLLLPLGGRTGCTWIPEVLGNPVQAWVVRGENGSDSSSPCPRPRPDHSPQG